MADDDSGLLLGKHTPVVEVYTPQLLYPIPRVNARSGLGIRADALPFHGVDIWHAYEMSWLDGTGKPVVCVGRFTVPATSDNLVESKSFKLYLNSLNNTRFESRGAAKACIEADLSAAACGAVSLELFDADDPALAGVSLAGYCLDEVAIAGDGSAPDLRLLSVGSGEQVEERLFSHLLRSLCPVTGQPDWATVWIHYRGQPIDRAGLLGYIVGYRSHQEFHEQCVERMFGDIAQQCQPELLQIQAFYTRRGGLDINPFRSTQPDGHPQGRLNRQ